MKRFAITILAVAVLFAPSCYMDMEDESTIEPTELIHSEINADEAAADSLVSVANDQEAADHEAAGDFQAQTFCPTQGQSCSTSAQCSGLELCLGGTCRCECDPGAWCTSNRQCGFAGFCGSGNRCACY